MPHFCSGVYTFQIANATMLGDAYGSDFPMGYPLPVYPDTCDPDPDLYESYWNIIDIGLTISGCGVDTHDSNWDQIKALNR